MADTETRKVDVGTEPPTTVELFCSSDVSFLTVVITNAEAKIQMDLNQSEALELVENLAYFVRKYVLDN